MHPSASLILFTVAAGAGYGLLILVAALGLAGLIPRPAGLAGLGLALLLIGAGLASSALHLGRPERAWRAFSQWRSSWLSREAVLAAAGMPVALTFGAGWYWVEAAGWWRGLAAVSALLSLLTLLATAMIYASLKPVRQWHNRWVPPAFLAQGLASGAVLLVAVAVAAGAADRLLAAIAAIGLAGAWAAKLGYWRSIAKDDAASTAESATGLGGIGRVRLLDPPHGPDNYLLREMGYRVARRHAARLRRLAQGLGFALPLLLVGAVALAPSWALPPALAAAVSVSLGLLIERWLFFAEARHTLTLYYGAARA